jgi:hypothetical protein
MSAQDGIRRHEVRGLIQQPSPRRNTTGCETTAIVVGETESAPSKLALQDPVLFLQKLEDGLLVTVGPAGDDDREGPEHGRHGAREGHEA